MEMDKKKSGFAGKIEAIWNEISGALLNPDKLTDILDSIKNWRSYIVQTIGLPTTREISKVENLIANSQIKIQRLQSSIATLESLISKTYEPRAKPLTKVVKKDTAEPLFVKKTQPSKIGKKPPETLLEIDLTGKKSR